MFFKKHSKDSNGFIKLDWKNLYNWHGKNGDGCIVSDKISKEGYKVGYMYREIPSDGNPDSGWRFLAGNESESYMNDSNNCHVFKINTVCNYDRDIIPYLESEVGCKFVRIDDNNFEIDDGKKETFIARQK